MAGREGALQQATQPQMSDQDDDVSSVQPAQGDPELVARLAQRMNLAMDQSSLFRRKRGRTSDVAGRYGIGRVFAGKILEGTSECPLPMLKALALDLQVSTDYLLGITDDPRPNAGGGAPASAVETAAGDMKRLALYDPTKDGLLQPHGACDLPRTALPYEMWDSHLIVVRWRYRTAEAYVAFGGHLVVEVSTLPRDGAVHLVLWSGSRPELLQVSSARGGETYRLLSYDDRSDSQEGAATVFGLPDADSRPEADKGMLRVVGPVVGRIEMAAEGTQISATRATGSRFVGLTPP